jgi:hypothetical protein
MLVFYLLGGVLSMRRSMPLTWAPRTGRRGFPEGLPDVLNEVAKFFFADLRVG